MNRKLFAGAVLLVGLILIAGCTEQPQAGEELKIGVVASMTGSASTTGKDIWQSAVLAVEEINADGGVYITDVGHKVPVRAVLGDDESTREGGQKAVTRLITEDKVDILTGGFSSAVVSAHQSIVAQYGIPYIVTGASSPIITRRDDVDTSTIFHYCPTTDDYGRQTTLFVSEVIRPAVQERFGFPDDRPLRLALIYQDSPYGKGVQAAVIETIEKENLPVVLVAQETFAMGETDYRTLLTRVKAAKPDVVYPATFINEQIPLLTQARRDVGVNAIFLAVECNDDPDYYAGVGRYGDFSVIETRFNPYTIPVGPVADDTARFREQFEKRWGGFPGMMGASTYEGVYIAVQAVENAGTREKNAVTAALAALEMPEMVEAMEGGVVRFTDEYREARFALYMVQLRWDDGANAVRPVIVWPDNLAQGEFVLPDWFEASPA
ncbi:MAG: ABC transporter substrate-binding protein [Methanoregulaceae archaeon]|jgi:branched-chain amino acid transport system substrate-binding protein